MTGQRTRNFRDIHPELGPRQTAKNRRERTRRRERENTMSTKSSIRHENSPDGTGFHLYTDFLDHCIGADVVHLELTGVEFEAAASGGGTAVTITLPRGMAERLGLLPPDGPAA